MTITSIWICWRLWPVQQARKRDKSYNGWKGKKETKTQDSHYSQLRILYEENPKDSTVNIRINKGF